MNFVSVTRLRVRKLRFLPGFGYYTLLTFIQSWRANGNQRTRMFHDRGLVFWTITVWKDEAAMRVFRNSGVHRKVMPSLAEWCDEATYIHWQQESDEPPELKIAYQRLVQDGVVSRVKLPSSNHAERLFEPPKD